VHLRASVLALLVVVGSAAGAARARPPRDEGPVLHEDVPRLGERDLSTLLGADGEAPVALVYEGQVLEAPEGGALGEDERMIGALPEAGAGAEVAPTFRPDRQTSLDVRVGYYAVFTPSVAPYKRVTALDAVEIAADGTPTLTVSDPAGVVAPVIGAGEDEPGRARFFGSVVLDFRGGHRVPLPSVAPEARILTAETEPEVALRFERDAADNFFAVADSPPREPVRLTFLTDAPTSHFNAEIPEVPADALASHVPPMPTALKRRALGFARELGIEPGDSLPFTLASLVEHFRSFREGEHPPVDTGDIYLDLARGGLGVCRHRAYAFVITAQALGIPARYVQNEAHAWVEVELGRAGFMRIDLGGAAVGMDAHGLADRPLYRPERADPLPRPPAFLESMGASPDAFAGASAPGTRAAMGADPSSREASAERSEVDAAEAPSEPASTDATAAPLRIEVEPRAPRAYRGRTLDLRGRVVDANGDGVAGLRVEVSLDDPGGAAPPRRLGVTLTHEHGWFAGTFGIPVDVAVGEYPLRVRTPGDATHAAAEAR
jgi:hypothetical protein